ncbi:Pyruvate carboxylase subunit B [Peptoniphilus sp. ING2-D1G]|nr:Pyruvate carboxylase subunit B [Peptoniphilus sp. ING2-D1G]
MSGKRIEFVDTTLRDAHQSLMATRLSWNDFKDSLELMDEAGYKALECWGGATFDSCIRFLGEDPWERLRNIKSKLKNTKTQMLLRGQNLLGYKNYPDDIVEKFVELSIKNGIDIVRVFDALNDLRNLEVSIESVKKYAGEVQVAIAYTVSDIHSTQYYIDLCKDILEMGADSIAIKDMSGILTPYKAYELVKSIKTLTDLPLEIHSHCAAGMAQMSYLKSIEAGADIIDTAISPFAGGTSQPAAEAMHVVIKEMGYTSPLNLEKLEELASFFAKVKEKYIEKGTIPVKLLSSDPKGLIYQVPGGMLSNLYSQLKSMGKVDCFEKVLNEIPHVRKDLGYPPLVTPMSQMVGSQATFNVIMGERYKMVPTEIKEYLRGFYGKSPAPIDEDFKRSIIGDLSVIKDRPANHLDPLYDSYKEEYGDKLKSEEDLMTYILFPEAAEEFFKSKYA